MPPDTAPFQKLENFDPNLDCFACGPNNPWGLHMTFRSDGQRLFCRLAVPSRYCGWEGVVHGGIVTAILDEIMSWSAHHLIRRLILTRSIRVEFTRPVPAARELSVEGWVAERVNDREAVMESEIRDADGTLCARGTGVFALLTPALARRLGIIEERVIAAFEAFYDTP